jgi:hypothetical protein
LAAASPNGEDWAEYLHLPSGLQVRRPRGWPTSQLVDRFGDHLCAAVSEEMEVKFIILRRLNI